MIRTRKQRHHLADYLATTSSELRHYRAMYSQGLRGCHCAVVTATLLPDGSMIFCSSGREFTAYDTKTLGFSGAFAKLRPPICDGCTCVGKLRISKVCDLDPAVIWDLVVQRGLKASQQGKKGRWD
ncbi:MAG TPA: hypothetical protein PKL24_14570 [Polyangiaceae bacterium]|nr:hypothetical protein [Polyangiaceae bacterium]HOE50186.1 hypothetical protein [Polyangiaceae bacterium]HOR37649.1 hypothetical protein [Polyangiaceae bacterium]HPK95648.1 hypothetical protein [Polyangiaceae bacterium]